MLYDVVVVGGGLAGSSLARQLALQGLRVALLEQARYPAAKLCGEFLSTEVQGLFSRLGVLAAVQAAGAVPMREALVTAASGAAFRYGLPGTALGLSRYRLDHLLFAAAADAGATAVDGCRVRAVAGSLGDGFRVEDAQGRLWEARAVVGAYGKRSLLDRTLGRPFLQRQEPFLAFKAHYEGADLGATIELHGFEGGYCGLSPVEEGRVNACWIAHEEALRAAGGRPEAMIEHTLRGNPYLRARFDALRLVDDRLLAISQISFARKDPFARDVLMVGDTAGLITPLCGDGMAMALEGAELAAHHLAAYLGGAATAGELRTGYAAAWQKAFGRRLRLGRWLHHAYGRPRVADLGIRLCDRVPRLARWLILQTRTA